MPARIVAQERLAAQLATLSAHITAATARWLEVALEFRRQGGADLDGLERWLAYRCGISPREAREYVRVAEALEELPALRAAFARGELTFSKLRALTRVATPASEQALLELAQALTCAQLERAVRAFRRITEDEARGSHELEYVDYHWAEDGSLYLRARLAAEDGTIVVRALEAVRDRVYERRREERSPDGPEAFEPPRSANVEALVELAQSALSCPKEGQEAARAELVVHVDAGALVGGRCGRSELAEGPAISPETARRLGCDARLVARVERDGRLLSVGRRRRAVPPRLRRLLDERDGSTCRFPGCERRRHLHAHHLRHWAQGGETSLRNLILLCFHHHRLVHEGGYTIEEGARGELRFRNRYGVLCPGVSRPPP
ncbi:MAG TPA: DUF222 domain-containing protein, partial [Gaiellaceae bacterium]|nr:DUF222 domain-containing protein [Gaiellaceae bacterium]